MFGDNSLGNLGMGPSTNSIISTPMIVESLQTAAEYGIKVSSISVGENHTIAIMNMQIEENPKSDIFVWGSNSFNQLGLKDAKNQIIDVPHQLDPESFKDGFSVVDAHSSYSAAVDTNGNLWTWGRGDCERLGYRAKFKVQKYPKVVYLSQKIKIMKVSLGGYHAMALDYNGRVLTWGAGISGQLGHGKVQKESPPKVVKGLMEVNVIQIAAGDKHNVVLNGDGDVYGWGSNIYGQLSLGSSKGTLKPKMLKNVACK